MFSLRERRDSQDLNTQCPAVNLQEQWKETNSVLQCFLLPSAFNTDISHRSRSNNIQCIEFRTSFSLALMLFASSINVVVTWASIYRLTLIFCCRLTAPGAI